MSREHHSGGGIIIIGSFIPAFILSQMPVPHFLEWWRPEWVLMVLVYWVIALPERVGVFSGFCVGLILDILRDTPLGLNALSLTIIAYFAELLHKRLRMFPFWQAAVMVGILAGINQLLFHWMQRLTGTISGDFMFLLPALMTGIMWPWLFVLLRGVRRTFHVS